MNTGNSHNDALAEFFSEAGVDYQALLGHENWWNFTIPRACIKGTTRDLLFIRSILKFPVLLNIDKGLKLATSMIRRAQNKYQSLLAIKFYDLLLADRLSKRDVYIISMALTAPSVPLKKYARTYFDHPILDQQSMIILTEKTQRQLQSGAESKDWNAGKSGVAKRRSASPKNQGPEKKIKVNEDFFFHNFQYSVSCYVIFQGFPERRSFQDGDCRTMLVSGTDC